MSARLPTPGGDATDWGTLLNTFLLVDHQPDGTSRLGLINATAGPNPMVGDGVTDNTAAFQAKLDQAVAANVPLYIPPGLYLTQPVTATDGVRIIGAGIAPWYKYQGVVLANAATTIRGTSAGSLLTLGAPGAAVPHARTRISGMLFDGQNLSNYGLDINDWYGVALNLDHCIFQNFINDGIGSTVGNATGITHAFSMNWNEVIVMNCNTGVHLVGHVQASTFTHCYFSNNTSAGVFLSDTNALTHGVTMVGCVWDFINANAFGLRALNLTQLSLFGCYFELDQAPATAIQLSAGTWDTEVDIFGGFILGNGAGQGIQLATNTHQMKLSVYGTTFQNCNTGAITGANQTNVDVFAERLNLTGTTPSFLTQNRGHVNIPSGQSQLVINHGLFKTPNDVYATLRAGNFGAGPLYVSAVGPTTFTVFAAGPVTQDQTISWQAYV